MRHGTIGGARRRRAARAMEETPTEIDGMRVLFDKRVTLFPVTLVEPSASPTGGSSGASNGYGTSGKGANGGGDGYPPA